jgi:hypothetical protein
MINCRESSENWNKIEYRQIQLAIAILAILTVYYLKKGG